MGNQLPDWFADRPRVSNALTKNMVRFGHLHVLSKDGR